MEQETVFGSHLIGSTLNAIQISRSMSEAIRDCQLRNARAREMGLEASYGLCARSGDWRSPWCSLELQVDWRHEELLPEDYYAA